MLRMAIMFGSVAALAGSTGCMTPLKQAFHTVRGAQGKFYEVQVVDPDTLAAYRSVRVEPFSNDLGMRVPGDVIFEVNDGLPKTLDESDLFYPDGKALLVKGRIIHFTGKSGISGSVSSVLGGSEECVCRVQLVDAESGSLVGEAVCWGVVKSAVRRGAGELGAGVGKGVVEWIEKRLPEEEQKARKEELKGD